jgi:hypothetical protein
MNKKYKSKFTKKDFIKRKINLNVMAIILISLIIISVLLIVNHILSAPFYSKIINVEFEVNNTIGFDVNTTSLKFGKIIPGGTSTRSLEIDNPFDFELNCKIFGSNNIVDLMIAPENMTLPPKNSTTISISLNIPQNYKYGKYYGKIRIEMRR